MSLSKLNELSKQVEKFRSTKITGKRKAVDNIQQLLSNPECLKQLDRSTSARNDNATFGLTTWTSLFEIADEALVSELKKLTAGKKPETYALIKCILEKTRGRLLPDGEPCISTTQLLEHVHLVMQDYPLLLASEYAQLLATCILQERVHWRKFHVEIGILCSRTLHLLTKGLCVKTDLRPYKLFTYYAQFFYTAKTRNAQISLNMVQACNALCLASASNFPLQVAEMGRKSSMHLLAVWQSTANDSLKGKLVDFFSLQIIMHEQTELTEDNLEKWKEILWQLYKILYQEVENTKRSSSQQQASGRLPPLWTEKFFCLLADICYLLLPDGDKDFEDVTQIKITQSEGPAPKKRRVLSGWDALIESIKFHKDSFSQAAWLTMCSHLFAKSPCNIPVDKYVELVEAFTDLIGSTKQPHTLGALRLAIDSLATVQRTNAQTEHVNALWRRITAQCVNLVERDNVEFYNVLITLMKHKMLSQQGHLCSLIKSSISDPQSHQGLAWLQTFLDCHQLTSFTILNSMELELENLPREIRSNDLWPHVWVAMKLLQSYNAEDGTHTVISCLENVSAQQFAHLLASLVCRDVLESHQQLPPVSRFSEISETLKGLRFAERDLEKTSTVYKSVSPLHWAKLKIEQQIKDRAMTLAQLLTNEEEEHQLKYLCDSLWLVELVASYCDKLDGETTLCSTHKEFWIRLSPHLEAALSQQQSADALLSTLNLVIGRYSTDRMNDIPLSLAEIVGKCANKLLDTKKSSQSISDSCGSISDSGDEFRIPAVPLKRNGRATDISSTDDESVYHIKFTAEHKSTYRCCKILTRLAKSAASIRSQVPTLMKKIYINVNTNTAHAHIILKTINIATGWNGPDKGVVTSLIIMLRWVVLRYYDDVSFGVDCLNVLERIITMIWLSDLTAAEKTDPGSKAATVLNGILAYIYKKSDEPDGTFGLYPLFGENYRLAAIRCLATLHKADPGGEWCKLVPLKTGPYMSKCLIDPLYTVRQSAVQNITMLFKQNYKPDGSSDYLPRDTQESMMNAILKDMHSIHEITDKIDDIETIDEQRCRTASVLSLYRHIISDLPACSKKALFAVFILLEQNAHVTIDLIHKVISEMTDSVEDFCLAHLPYLALQWTAADYLLLNFPCQLLGEEDIGDFLRENIQCFLPSAFGKADRMKELTRVTGMNNTALAQQNIAVLVSTCLPGMANKLNPTARRKSTEQFNRIKALLEDNNVQINSLINKELPDIVLLLFGSIWDSSPSFPSEPEPNPLTFSFGTIQNSLELLLSMVKSSQKDGNLISIIAKEPTSVLNLLHKFSSRMAEETPYLLKQSVTRYVTFTSCVIKDLPSSLEDYGLHLVETIASAILVVINQIRDMSSRINHNSQHYLIASLTELMDCLADLIQTSLAVDTKLLHGILPKVSHMLSAFKQQTTHDRMKSASSHLLEQVELCWASSTFDPILATMDCLTESMEASNKQKQLRSDPGLATKMEIFLANIAENHDRMHSLDLISKLIKSAETKELEVISEGHNKSLVAKFISCLMDRLPVFTQLEREAAMACLSRLTPLSPGCTWRSDCNMKVLGNKSTLNRIENSLHRDYLLIYRIIHYMRTSSLEVMYVCNSVLAAVVGGNHIRTLVEKLFSLQSTSDNGNTDITLDFLEPYLKGTHKQKTTTMQSRGDATCWDLWNVTNNMTYIGWVTSLTTAFCDVTQSPLLKSMKHLCLVKPEFCEELLPYLIHERLSSDSSCMQMIANRITQLLRTLVETTDETIAPPLSWRNDAIRTVLNIMQYLRTQTKPVSNDVGRRHTLSIDPETWSNNFWLPVDYSLMAKAALMIDDAAMAVMYSEIWAYHTRDVQNMKMEAILCESQRWAACNIQSLMLDAYSSLSCEDALYGWGVHTLTDSTSRAIHYEKDNLWGRVLTTRDNQLVENSTHQKKYMQALQACGLNHTRHVLNEAMNCPELLYEQAWKSMTWDKLSTPVRLDVIGYDECMFGCLKSLSAQNFSDLLLFTKHLDNVMMKELTSVTAHTHWAVTMNRANCAAILKDISSTINSQQAVDQLCTSWIRGVTTSEHSDIDQLTIQSVLYKVKPTQSLAHHLVDRWLTASKRARQEDCPQLSENLLNQLQCLLPDLWSEKCSVEQAKVYWQFGENDRAMNILKTCGQQLNTTDSNIAQKLVRAQTLRVMGEWRWEMKLDGTDKITEEFLYPALTLASQAHRNTENKHNELLECHHTLACFADSEYERIKAYRKGPEYTARHSLLASNKSTVARLPNVKNEVASYKNKLEKSIARAEQELTALSESYQDHISCALKSYCNCLIHGDKYDLHCVFRVVSLWFDHAADNPEVAATMTATVAQITPHKFLPLICQIAARLSEENTPFQSTLQQLIRRTGSAHPHHVIPFLMALYLAAKDVTSSKKISRSNTAKRSKVAGGLLKSLKLTEKSMCKDYETVFTALISLANLPIPHSGDKTIPNTQPILASVKNMHTVPVLTANIKVDKSGVYADIPMIQKYRNKYITAGGVNLPKIIFCVGSDGKAYKQLAKGRDDPRQDAAMQQVFRMVNQLLKKDKHANHLSMRTYQVIPLSQRSGLLEWCEGTIPFKAYLDEAHTKYCPPEEGYWTARKCMNHIQAGQMKDLPTPATNFREINEKYPAVFRHFFFERFLTPQEWHDRHVSYAQSLATSSIVGYILGVGDRHVSNILLDTKTAEVVHIDLGIAFDQGKNLPVPEAVPFRLTPDMVDGLGVIGVEGLFRRSCKKTMAVMRIAEKVISTILRVLIDDPLLNWSLSPEKLEEIQKIQLKEEPNNAVGIDTQAPILLSGVNNTDDVDVAVPKPTEILEHQMAETVLLKLQQKLSGREDNTKLSIEGQVNMLIQQATDAKNLGSMYKGWSSFM